MYVYVECLVNALKIYRDDMNEITTSRCDRQFGYGARKNIV